MNLEYIRQFLVLAEQRNFTKAAKIMNVSQPAFTRHMQDIETELGRPLLWRTTKTVELTEYGKLFLPYAQQMIQVEDQCRAALEAHENQNHLSIGAINFPQNYGITTLIAKFEKKYPGIYTDISLEKSDDLIEKTRNGEYDFAFVRDFGNQEKSFCFLPYMEDRLTVIFSREHPLAGTSPIRMEQLKNETFYFQSGKDSMMERLCLGICRKSGFEPQIAQFRGQWMNEILSDRHGVTLVMHGYAERYLKNERICIAELIPPTKIDICVIWKKDNCLTEAGNCFLEFMQNMKN
jgi:DNA-binding transcriptional LysR family regulator